jgi:hypothetical protein
MDICRGRHIIKAFKTTSRLFSNYAYVQGKATSLPTAKIVKPPAPSQSRLAVKKSTDSMSMAKKRRQ